MTNRRLFAPLPVLALFQAARRPRSRSLARRDRAARHRLHATQSRARIAARPELRESPENFLEGMIAAQENDGAFSDEEIVGNVFTLLLAGEDTTLAHAWPGRSGRWPRSP